MPELPIPDPSGDEFREHFRALIAESVRRSDRRSGRRHLRSSVRLVWVAALVLLLVDLAVFGVDSWTTSVADIGLIVLTLAWFWVCVDDLLPARSATGA